MSRRHVGSVLTTLEIFLELGEMSGMIKNMTRVNDIIRDNTATIIPNLKGSWYLVQWTGVRNSMS